MTKELLSALAVMLLCSMSAYAQDASHQAVPPPSLKVPAMVPEKSVSTFVPSTTAPGQGLAVNIIYPAKPRYSEGAPVVVVVPGGMAADGLDFSLHAAQSGFAEVRFALPGGGKRGLSSGGTYDYRGANSAEALRDIFLFAAGKKNDYQGRTISKLLPVAVVCTNCGAVGWSNGGNLLLVTLGRFGEELNFLKWIAFYESPVGALFYPPALGSAQDFLLNRHYREGSCATGDCLIDFRKLAWQGEAQKSPGAHKRLGEPEVKGVLYFDENKNKQWDEISEFAFPYAAYPGFDKQFYPPQVLKAVVRLKLFETTRPVAEKKKKMPGARDEVATTQEGQKKFFGLVKGKPLVKKEAPVKLETVTVFPPTLATLAESEKYFRDRDGSLYITDVCEKMPRLLVTVFGSRTDHLQGQADHPHIAFLYNAFLANRLWVRLNPDPLYARQVALMNVGNFIDNKPKTSIDASAMDAQLEPEGLVPDYVFMDAVVAELADRRKKNKLDSVLTEPLVGYSNGAKVVAAGDAHEQVSQEQSNKAAVDKQSDTKH